MAPNPCVGAAVLSGGRVVARGFHERWGGPHAEVQALAAARARGEEAGDTVVCTLEPCSTQGKTGACTDVLLAAGLSRVVVGAHDPDARHRGRGLELLRERGLECLELTRGAPLDQVAPHFLAWNATERVRRPRPWVIAKWAQTRSGQLTPPADVGEGRWISGPESLAEVHGMRGRVDAILTGVGTVLRDDPRLTVRPPGGPIHPAPARGAGQRPAHRARGAALLDPDGLRGGGRRRRVAVSAGPAPPPRATGPSRASVPRSTACVPTTTAARACARPWNPCGTSACGACWWRRGRRC